MSADVESLNTLYVEELKDLYSAESQITKALPKVIKKESSPQLKKGLQDHLEETKGHVERLNRIFESMGRSPRGKKCMGMEGLLHESSEMMSEKMASPYLMDAALISGCQKVEHYEIASYGTVRAFAELLGDHHAVDLLSQTLKEEKAADEKLSQVGMNMVNPQALQVKTNGSKNKVHM